MSVESAPPPSCQNCSAPLHGAYCHACGQRDLDLATSSVGAIIATFVRETFQADGRLPRTVWPLLRRPGLIVAEYLTGRRVRYTSPVKLYLVVSVVAFFVLRLEGAAIDGMNLAVDVDGVSGDERAQVAAIQAIVGAVRRGFFDAAPLVMLGMIPLFALALRLMLPRRRYVEHVIFALNVHTIGLLLLAIAGLASSGWLRLGALLIGELYLALALRRVYQVGWPRTLLTTLGLALVHLLLALLGLVLVVLLAVVLG